MILLALSVVLSLSPGEAQSPVSDSMLIARAQRTLASTLETSLPRVSIEQWLSQIAAILPDSLRWEVNDCGEGGDGRTTPTCVEAAFDLPGGSAGILRLYVMGRDGSAVRPAIAELLTSTGGTYSAYKTFGDWLAAIRRRRGRGTA